MSEYVSHTGKLTPAGQRVAAELYDPAVSAMVKWLADGEVSRYSRYGQLPQHVLDLAQLDRDLREDIALETFVSVLPGFLTRLDNNFDANRGASEQTFFIGACRNRLGDVIRSHQAPVAELRADTDELLALLRSSDAGLADIEGRDLARYLLLRAPHDLRDALMLHIYEGITLVAAAKRLGLNPATVRSHLRRFRKKLLRQHFDEKISIPENTALGQWIRKQTPAVLSDQSRIATYELRIATYELQPRPTKLLELGPAAPSRVHK